MSKHQPRNETKMDSITKTTGCSLHPTCGCSKCAILRQEIEEDIRREERYQERFDAELHEDWLEGTSDHDPLEGDDQEEPESFFDRSMASRKHPMTDSDTLRAIMLDDGFRIVGKGFNAVFDEGDDVATEMRKLELEA